MTDWRSSDDPARGEQPQYPGYGAAQGEYPQDPHAQPYGQTPYGQSGYAQSGYAQDPYGQNPYAQNPYGGQNPYGQNSYGQNPYGGQNSYGPTPPQGSPYGYPGPGLGLPPQGYGIVHPADRRPGTLVASAVLGFVNAGFLIIASFYCFIGASAVESFNENFDNDGHSYSVQFVLAGVANLVAAGLLIAGGITLLGRKPNGRIMYAVGCGIVLLATVYWVAVWATKVGGGGLTVIALLFAGLSIVGSAFAFTGGGNRWLGGRSAAIPQRS